MSPTRKAPLLRKLGRDGPQVPAVGLGLMGFSAGYGTAPSDEERLKLLDRAWELGCTSWDTADAYGDSEELIGKWFKLHPERRKDIFLATKFGLKGGLNSSPQNCREAVEQSLKALGVDFIDLYYLHRAKAEIPIEKTMEAMKELVQNGKVKYLGLSEVSSSTLRRAHAIHPISAVQMEYSPWTLDVEGPSGTHLLKTCEELDVSIFAYHPLGSGMLTGKYRSTADFSGGGFDLRSVLSRFKSENFDKNLEVADKFVKIAEKHGYTGSQLALAWLLAQSDLVFVIPGTKRIKYLEENWGAATIELTKEEEQEVRALVDQGEVKGDRDNLVGHFIDTVPLES